MNNKIEFKKDLIMKTVVSEITDISLTHDYKILDDVVEGYFDVTGEYKVSKSSVTKEEFMFSIPFSIALSSLINKDTIDLTIYDFKYEIEKDIIHLKMVLNMDYDEIEDYMEEEDLMDYTDEIINSVSEEDNKNEYHNELMNDLVEDNVLVNEQKSDIKEETDKSVNNIINEMKEESFYKYKVYIMREEDTIESIAIKYNVTLDDLREYNVLENINIGDKIIIPSISNEKN